MQMRPCATLVAPPAWGNLRLQSVGRQGGNFFMRGNKLRNLISRYGSLLPIYAFLLCAGSVSNAQTFSNGGPLSNGIIAADCGWNGQINSVNVAGRFIVADLDPGLANSAFAPYLFTPPL